MSEQNESKVVRLVTPQVEEDDTYQAAMVEMCERMLEAAKKGELRSMMVVYSNDPSNFQTAWAGRVNVLERIGYLHVALAGLSGCE